MRSVARWSGRSKGELLYGAFYSPQAEHGSLNHDNDPDTQSDATPLPVVIERSAHTISRSQISPNSLKVLYRLKEAGYQACLVGGAVRDLLLGRAPKDFDVATNAHPEQVREQFRNCRLIGRRFHLAHVRYGQDIIEVATFRAAHTVADDDNSVDEDERRVTDGHGRILRDNLYGSIEEDVWRRDFTANALYYNIHDFSIWDYVGGFADVNARVLRLIGDPETRYREDPVRMLRAIRFAAKLDFSIHPDSAKPIPKLAGMLDAVPPARLFDEITKLFLAGSALRSFALLRQYGLLEHLFADLAAVVKQDPVALRLVELGLEGTDKRVADGKSVTPAFLFAVLMWPVVWRHAREYALEGSEVDMQALLVSWDTVSGSMQRHVAVPKRFSLTSREVVGLQPRFEYRSGKRSLRLLEHPRFRAAYDFMLLRTAAGEFDPEAAEWWTRIQEVPVEERALQLQPAAAGGVSAGASSAEPAKKKRRRRRGGSRSRGKPAAGPDA